jgi:hypothetical protein
LRSHLTDKELDNLYKKVILYFQSYDFAALGENQLELALTKAQIGPALKKIMLQLGFQQMIIRFDGDSSVKPLVRYGMTFLPDLQAYIGMQKILAIEVKILRDQDASGALNKAIGQTFIYRELGYEMAIGMIFDKRIRKSENLFALLDSLSDKLNRTKFLLFN